MKCICRLLIAIALIAGGCSSKSGSPRPSEDGLLFDQAGIVEQNDELLRVLEHYQNQFGVEMVIATVDSLSDMDINQYAQKLFSDWRIGEKHGGKGVLMVVVGDTGEGRLEIAYELEHILTDMMCGRIIRNQVRPFWEMDMVYVGMLDAVFLISERSRLLAYDRGTSSEKARSEDEFLSGGGGVTLPIEFGLGYETKMRLPSDDRDRFGPGQSPLEVVEKYRLAMSGGINDNTLEMYTPETQVFFVMEPTLTKEYQTYADIIGACGPFKVKKDDSRAVVRMRKACQDRFPIFCRKGQDGWQLDWVTFFHAHGRKLTGGWTMHRVPVGYEHLVSGTEKVAKWSSRLPVNIDRSVDFRLQVGEAERLLKENAHDPERNLRLADLYLSCWRWPDALRLYSRGVVLAPDQPRYLAALAEAKYYLYLMKSARKNFEKLQAYPEWRGHSVQRLKQINNWQGD